MPGFVDLSRPQVPEGIEEKFAVMQGQIDVLSEKHDEVVEMVTRIAKVIGVIKASLEH